MPELRTLKQAMRVLERLDADDQKKARRLSLRAATQSLCLPILREHTENRNGHQYTKFYGRRLNLGLMPR
jgi:hypothetical protein